VCVADAFVTNGWDLDWRKTSRIIIHHVAVVDLQEFASGCSVCCSLLAFRSRRAIDLRAKGCGVFEPVF